MAEGGDYIDSQGFRANVGIVLMHDDGRVFLGGRAGARGWQFPQGGILRGERAEDAMYRELGEEVGLAPRDVEQLGRTRGWHTPGRAPPPRPRAPPVTSATLPFNYRVVSFIFFRLEGRAIKGSYHITICRII